MTQSHPLAASRRQLSTWIHSNWFSQMIAFAMWPSAALIGFETGRRALYATEANRGNRVALNEPERIDTRVLPAWRVL